MEHNSKPGKDAEDKIHDVNGDESKSVDRSEVDGILWEANLSQIRNIVNENKIKLWLSPYFEPGVGSSDAQLLELAATLGPSLELDEMVVFKGLQSLQKNALDKLDARAVLNSSGKMSLKIKLAKTLTKDEDESKQSVSVDANSTGKELVDEISKLVGCNPSSLMLISNGRTVNDDSSLTEQNLKPGSTVMVVQINKSDHSWSVAQEQKRLIQLAKHDAEILGSSNDLEIANQNGEALDLPQSEKNALILAMSYHEKGRSALKRGNHDLALVFFLEAATQYQACRADILKVVDNYGLLNLDIAWCYLHLGNMSELPNAEQRLHECEESFAKTYGANLERLNSVKGTADAEAVLLLRLRLLKAIVAFHNGHRRRSIDLFHQASAEIQRLDVPEDLIDEVAAQGFSRHEARLALRVSGNRVPAAVRHAQQMLEIKAEREKAEMERRKKRRELGKTSNGSWVNLGYLQTIIKQGYEEKLAAIALRQTDNDLDAALIALEDNIETLLYVLTNEEVTPEKVTFVADNGFTEDEARDALEAAQGDVEKAIMALGMKQSEDDPSLPGTSSAENTSEAKRQKREAKERMEDILPTSNDEYLDLPLTEEKAFLTKYKNILGI